MKTERTVIYLTAYQRFYADAQGQATLGPHATGQTSAYLRLLLLRDMLAHREDLCRSGPLAPPDGPARDEWRALTDALLFDGAAPPYPLPAVPTAAPAAAETPPRPADPKLAHLSIIDLARALRRAADTLADPAPTKRIRAQFTDLRSTAETLAHEMITRARDLLHALPDTPPAEPAPGADEAPFDWAAWISSFGDTDNLRMHTDMWREAGFTHRVQLAEAELARREGREPPPVPPPAPSAPPDLTDEQRAERAAWNMYPAELEDPQLQQFARERVQTLLRAQAEHWPAEEIAYHQGNLDRLRGLMQSWGIPWPADAEQNTS